MLRFGFKHAVTGGVPPAFPGDFAWYQFVDPDGYYTDTSTKKRYARDYGYNLYLRNVPTGNNGKFPGLLNSGRAITLENDGYIDVPITSSSYITYYDFSQHQFVVPSLSGDTFRLENVEFNNLVMLDGNSFTQADLDLLNEDQELLVKWAMGEHVLSIPMGNNDRYYACTNEGAEIIDIDDSQRLPINGTYSRNFTAQYGLQTLRLELNDTGLPTKVIDKNQVKFQGKGEQIDTGIKVDGSNMDFTLMIAIDITNWDENGTYAEFMNGKGVSSANNNMKLAKSVNNKLSLSIGNGNWNFNVDFSKPINALCAIYDHNTGEVKGALNGEPLQVLGTIVFDKPHTSTIQLGGLDSDTQRTVCFMGEIIIAMAKPNNPDTTWADYWNKVKA